MSTHRQIQVSENRKALVDTIADRLVDVIVDTLDKQNTANIVLTGGSVGIEILAAVGQEARRLRVDWTKVHLWWGDERWLPSGDPERNEVQAEQALLRHLATPPQNIHRFPASDGSLDLDAAADEYSRVVDQFVPASPSSARFDVVLLGMGPDAHIASLFPGHAGIRDKTSGVIAVRNSPKPPPERLSMTLPLINSAGQVWLCLAGADKASALGLALAGASVPEVPAAGVLGIFETVFYVDSEAAANVPEQLLGNSDSV